VVVAGQLPREPHNAPLHLFSASPELVGFGQTAYRRRSESTSLLLGQLFGRLRAEGFTMSYTMEDFKRDLLKEYFPKLPLEEQREVFLSMPPDTQRAVLESFSPEARRALLKALPEERLAGLSAEQIRKYLNWLTAGRSAGSPRPRRKK
jgi:hypothetical protein